MSAREDARDAKYVTLENGTRWPDPRKLEKLGVLLEFGEPSREDLLLASACVTHFVRIHEHMNGKRAATLRKQIRSASHAPANEAPTRREEGTDG